MAQPFVEEETDRKTSRRPWLSVFSSLNKEQVHKGKQEESDQAKGNILGPLLESKWVGKVTECGVSAAGDWVLEAQRSSHLRSPPRFPWWAPPSVQVSKEWEPLNLDRREGGRVRLAFVFLGEGKKWIHVTTEICWHGDSFFTAPSRKSNPFICYKWAQIPILRWMVFTIFLLFLFFTKKAQ